MFGHELDDGQVSITVKKIMKSAKGTEFIGRIQGMLQWKGLLYLGEKRERYGVS